MKKNLDEINFSVFFEGIQSTRVSEVNWEFPPRTPSLQPTKTSDIDFISFFFLSSPENSIKKFGMFAYWKIFNSN